MTLKHGLTRILAAALAIAAVAAPAAVAQPAQTWSDLYAVAPLKALGTDVSAPDQQSPASGGQDLRSPDAADPSVPVSGGQDLRSPDAADPSMPSRPQPIEFSPVKTVEKDATSWSTIGLLLGGACLALAGAAITAGRIRGRTATA
jgi:hypothetical protein